MNRHAQLPWRLWASVSTAIWAAREHCCPQIAVPGSSAVPVQAEVGDE